TAATPLHPGYTPTTLNAATAHSAASRPSAECHQPDGRVQLGRDVGFVLLDRDADLELRHLRVVPGAFVVGLELDHDEDRARAGGGGQGELAADGAPGIALQKGDDDVVVGLAVLVGEGGDRPLGAVLAGGAVGRGAALPTGQG